MLDQWGGGGGGGGTGLNQDLCIVITKRGILHDTVYENSYIKKWCLL